LVLAAGLAGCDDGAMMIRPALDAGAAAVDVEVPAVDGQTAVAVDTGTPVPCITVATCADGFHRTPLSEHYDALSIYACSVDTGVNGSEIANPCGAGDAYGYRSADVVTCRCH
jgi:hypothetical protein